MDDSDEKNLKRRTCGEDEGGAVVVKRICSDEDKGRDGDSKQLLSIFPEEVWTLILEEITDNPDILTNLTNASQYFRRFLLPRRVLFLFPKVRAVLEAHNKKLEDKYHYKVQEWDANDYWGNAGPYPQKLHLPWNSIMLNIRLVCHCWRAVVDHFYQSLSCHYKMKEDFDEKGKDPQLYDAIEALSVCQVKFDEEKSPGQIQKFLDHFDVTHPAEDRSPFFGRAVAFRSPPAAAPIPWTDEMADFYDYQPRDDLDTIPEAPQYWNGIFTVLQKYGDHIWYCEMHVEDKFSTRVAYYQHLKQWLQLMPNLKTLHLKYSRSKLVESNSPRDGWPPQEYIPPRQFHPTSEDIAKLNAEVRIDPPPILGDLQFLKTTDLPAPILNALIGANCHLSLLEIERQRFHQNYDIYSTPMLNLKGISMKFYEVHEFETLEASQNAVRWPLQKIHLDFHQCPFINWPRIFEMLQSKWKDSLVELVIALPKAESEAQEKQTMKDMDIFELKLKAIQRIKLKIRHRFYSLDFLKCVKKNLKRSEVVTGGW